MTAAMQESRDKGRTKTNEESDASFGGLGARPAMEGWRRTDPFVGRRGGDATPGTALRCRRAGRALGSGVREVDGVPKQVAIHGEFGGAIRLTKCVGDGFGVRVRPSPRARERRSAGAAIASSI